MIKPTSTFTLMSFLLFSFPLKAYNDWQSFTLDNDLFVKNDNGYTNGLYYSRYTLDGPRYPERNTQEPNFLLKPLTWSVNKIAGATHLKSLTIGQSMNTPSDITLNPPNPNDIPYSGFLYLSSSFLTITPDYADKIATTVGIIGPSSGAEVVQSLIHETVGSQEPQGWDHQLKDEIVFQFSRARAWRSWASDKNDFDLVGGAEVNVGTIESSLAAGLMVRYGHGLQNSYAAPLLAERRTTNPVAIEGDWYFFAGLEATHLFNLIFTDGNTFHDGPSVDYDSLQLGATFGVAYSWQDFSITFAINDIDILNTQRAGHVDDLTRYGTLTFLWRG